jgi:hypothetical protein
MPGTFSLNLGQPTESTRKSTVFDVIQELPNNSQKLISPRDVRDAFLTSWASSAFRVTNPGVLSNEYIGIDSGNPSNRDIKNKILIGKRQYGNLDIMTNNLLNSDTDIFFYNTKPDGETQSSTKLAFITGTGSNLYQFSPYIESRINSSNTGFDLTIKNPSFFEGPINVQSSSGRVSINGVVFPTIAETSANAGNGKILRYIGTYPNGYLEWAEPSVSLAVIGNPALPTNIYGSTVSVNGYPIEFIEDAPVPVTMGGIEAGTSFAAGSFFNGTSYQNWPVVEVLRDILYPYVQPELSLSIYVGTPGNKYAEVGTTPSLTMTYSVKHYARESSEWISRFLISKSTSSITGTTFSGVPQLSFTGSPGSIFRGTASVNLYGSATNTTHTYYSFASNISPAPSLLAFPLGYSFSASASMYFVSPIVASFVPTSVLNFDIQAITSTNTRNSVASVVYGQTVSVNKRIVPYPGLSGSVTISATGSGFLYFMIPGTVEYNYGMLSQIKDPNGYIMHDVQQLSFSGFTYSSSTSTPSPPFTYYSSYRIYRTKLSCSYFGSGNFELIFLGQTFSLPPPGPAPSPTPPSP